MLEEIIYFVILGILTGTLAGLFGIGGGIFIVPGMTIILKLLNFPDNVIMKYAEGTSLSIMIFTSISTIYSHYKRNNILFDIFKKIVIWIVLGTILGAVIAHFVKAEFLEILFGIFLFLISMKMFLGFKIKKGNKKYPKKKTLAIAGSLIGLKSGILGIGGGSISVPFLSYFNVPMRKAAGTSASFTFPIAVIGAISFMILGMQTIKEPLSLGYIYLPAFFTVFPLTMIFANIGARLTHIFPNRALQIGFAVLLLLLSCKMFFFDMIFSF